MLKTRSRIMITVGFVAVGGAIAATSFAVAGASPTDHPQPPVSQAYRATATAYGYDGYDALGPPDRSRASEISANEAAKQAWGGPQPAVGANAFRAIRAHMVATNEGVDGDVWLMVLDGGCVPTHGPLAVTSNGGDPASSSPWTASACIREPLITAIDAHTGANLGGFAGGPNPDPAAVLAPEPEPAS